MTDDARTAILRRIRAATGGHAPPDLPRPLLGPRWRESHSERFLSKLEQAAAGWTRIAHLEALPGAIADYLRTRNLAHRVWVGAEPAWAGLNWADIALATGPDYREATVGLSLAYAGLAETGTLVLLSAPDTPTGLNFLPEQHLVVLRERDILGYQEEMWERLRQEGRALPRAVNFITGPSRTADIEQTLQLGAHGPKSLWVFLLG